MGTDLDDIDYAILAALQENARHNTNAAISERVGVSPSTVGKRIGHLESTGVVRGYSPDVDYERAGYPLEVIFSCTAPVTDRATFVRGLDDLDGVVNVRVLMTGTENVHIRVVGASKDDITEVAGEIDELGFDVVDEILVRDEFDLPSVRFTRDD